MMRAPPTDIMGQHHRRMAAFCDDLFDLVSGQRKGPSDTPRLDALLAAEKASDGPGNLIERDRDG